MKDSLLLLSNFIKNPKEVGAVAPSSKFLTREIIKHINFKTSKVIVELGPGVGTFTKAILAKAKPNAKLFCFEVNKNFCSYLAKHIVDKRLVVINAGAEKLSSNLKSLGIKEIDCVISGLPFRNFSDKTKKKIFKEIKNSLSSNGKFILFQYTNELSELLGSHFSRVEKRFVPLNVPPSLVYVCEK